MSPTAPATVGVTTHGNDAVLVTVAADHTLLDRRRIALTDGLPTHPHHHQGSWAIGRYLDSPWARPTTLPEALALVEQVRAAAARGAHAGLAALAADLGAPICAIAIRSCPELPPTVEQCITDHRAQTYADSVMYRRALAAAAEARGWSVHWYDRDSAFAEAASALGCTDVQAVLKQMGRDVGPPWRAEHKLAAAAAVAALAGLSTPG